MFVLKEIDVETRKEAISLIKENWNGPIIITKGKIHKKRSD